MPCKPGPDLFVFVGGVIVEHGMHGLSGCLPSHHPLAIRHDEGVANLLEHAGVAPNGKPTIDRAPRSKVRLQSGPLRSHDVKKSLTISRTGLAQGRPDRLAADK